MSLCPIGDITHGGRYPLSRRKRKKTKVIASKHGYKVVILDIDSSTFKDYVQAYSFEDALARVRGKFPGYTIKSVELEC